MKTPALLRSATTLALYLLGTALPVAAQTPTSPKFYPTTTPTPASLRPTVSPTPSGSGVTVLPEPTATPGKPFVPDSEAIRGQTAVTAVRRLMRDVQSNTDNIKAVGNFGAQLYLIMDETFYQEWRKPETPTITPAQLVVRGQTLYTAVIFYGPARDDKGLCQVTYDITVKRPDSSVSVDRKGMIGWQNLAPDERELMLGRNYLPVTVAPTDPVGIYTVEMIVHDSVGRVDLPLKQTFAVQ